MTDKKLTTPGGVVVYRRIDSRVKYAGISYDFMTVAEAPHHEPYPLVRQLINLLADRCFAAGRRDELWSSAGPMFVHFEVLTSDVGVVVSALDAWVIGNDRRLSALIDQLSRHAYPKLEQRKSMTVGQIRATPTPALADSRTAHEEIV